MCFRSWLVSVADELDGLEQVVERPRRGPRGRGRAWPPGPQAGPAKVAATSGSQRNRRSMGGLRGKAGCPTLPAGAGRKCHPVPGAARGYNGCFGQGRRDEPEDVGRAVHRGDRPSASRRSPSRSRSTAGSTGTTSVAGQAHARMLAEVGLLTAGEADRIVAALDTIGTDIEAGRMEFTIALEDIHTHIERALIAGPRRPGPQAAHGPQPQRPSHHRREAVGPRRHRRPGRPAPGRATRVRRLGGARRRAWCCRGTRTCSGRSRCWPGTTSWPTPRSSSGTASGSPTAASG